MDHSFNVDIAKIYGIHEAVFIQNLYFWILKNECNGRHFYEGRNWTYNSLSALEKLFPYFSRKQIRTVISNCVTKGAVIKGNFNKAGYDNTTWFALSEDVIQLYQWGVQTDISCAKTGTSYAEKGTSYAQKDPTIPDSKPYSKPDKDTSTSSKETPEEKTGSVQENFNRFWAAYPKKVAKGYAEKLFRKLRPDEALLSAMLQAIERAKSSDQWQRDTGQYIPNPSTWLNQRRWEDELPGTEPEPVDLPLPEDLAREKARHEEAMRRFRAGECGWEELVPG